ncbi:xylulokinase [uncultured Vagococcus sp.]|uniref:xylulokinase n=1 Tax=uncultured Vagococcus sp. TaxID=189676 RepID=UPI0028D270EB|nr:xylulokinase [uncultured Vagococcus sp.]
MSYLIGIDLGTSSLKGILLNRAGEIVTIKQEEYELITPQTGYSEQDPDVWTDALEQVIQQIIQEIPDAAERTEGISFSGQMHSLVLLGQEGRPLRPAILWNDVRTTPQCRNIMERAGQEVISITKNRALEGFTLPKILWVKEHEPEVWQQTTSFLLPKDYAGFYLTGNQQMDYSDAAGTLLLDVGKRTWSETIATLFELPLNIFPKLVNSSAAIGLVKPELAKHLGFTADVMVYAGGADNACAALGAGITREGMALASIGTSGVFLSYEKGSQADYHGDLHYFNHAAENAYYSMGVTLSAGYSLNWFKDTFAADKTYEELLHNLGDMPIGADGLLFSPYIMGERTPYADSQIRGSFIGMDARHTLDHFTRSVIEGITFSLKESQYIMTQHAKKAIETIISVGGGSKNKHWLQLQADIFDTTVTTLTSEQGPALGAAMIAAVGAGWYKDISECSKALVHYSDHYTPIPENVADYQRLYQVYQQVYPATKNICHELSDLS